MKRLLVIKTLLIALGLGLIPSGTFAAGFLDFPHKYNGCNNCHLGHHSGEPSLLPPFNCTTIDDTQHNNLCKSCHEGITAPDMETHSSIRFGTKYGNWSVECITCHFPHKQMQFAQYGSETYLYSEQSDLIELDTPSAGESRLTDDQASWTPDEFQNRILIANVNDSSTGFQGLGYKIKNNTATELILDGNIDTVKAPVGSDFAIIYGDLVKESVPLDNVIVYCSQSTSVPDDTTLTESGAGWQSNEFAGDTLIPNIVYSNYRYTIQSNTPSSITTVEPMNLSRIEVGRDFKIVRTVTGNNPVKFFNNNGTNSFADGDATYDGICEVCHTLTDHFRNDGSGPDQLHTSQGPSIPGINCTTCHFHNDGFAPEDCSRCHGFPPIEDVLNSASTGGNTGLTDDPGTTGSLYAGEHESHVNTYGYNDCNYCHNNSSSKDDPTHNLGLMVTMGFSQFSGAQQGGDYHGQTTVTYDYTATVPATSGSSNGTLTCDNLYCHSNVQDPVTPTNPPTVYGQPVWNDATSVKCGDCHDDDTTVADADHTGVLIDTGTHTEHVGTVYNFGCEKCHNGKGPGSPTTHVNNDIDIAFDAWNSGASYSQVPNVPEDGYGDCLSSYCHSDGQNPPVTYADLTWGTTLPADCTGCHDNDVAAAPNTMDTGAHLTHVDDTDQEIGWSIQCEVCHELTVSGNRTIISYANHVNTSREVDIKITGETDCTNIQCHSDGNLDSVSVVYNNPSWSPPASLGCVDCHGDGSTKSYPTYADGDPGGDDANSHNAHVGTSGIFCEECHVETSTVGAAIDGSTPTLHVNQTVEVDFVQGGSYDPAETCSNTYCHGTAPSPAWGDTATPLTCDDCHSGSGNTLPDSHTVHYDTGAVIATGSDFNPDNKSTAGNYIYTCGVCHDTGISHSGGPVTAGIQAGEVIFNDGFAGPSATYAPDTVAAGSDKGFPYTAGTCSTSYCHSDALASPTYNSPTWGGTNPETATCTWCHKNDVASGAPIDSGAHLTHVSDSDSEVGRDLGCVDCHEATVSGNRTISDRRFHVNNSKDVDIQGTETTCNNIVCHSDGNFEVGASTVYNNPLWNPPDTLGCFDCHGNGIDQSYPSYATGGVGVNSNSHDIHSGTANNIACGECHGATSTAGTALDGSSPTVHVDQTVDVVMSPGSYTDGSETCTSTLCHGDGSPQWGEPWGAAIDTCTKCHGTPSAPTAADYLRAPPVDTARDTGSDVSFVNTDAEIGAHQTHLLASDLTQTVSNGLSADVSCDECHPVPATVVEGVHLSGTPADVSLTGTLATTNGATPSYTAPTCTGFYCHGGAMPSGDDSGLNRTPNWADTTYLDGTPANDCKQCHGWPPRGGASASIHSGVADGTGCIGCHNFGINASNDGFDDPSQHIDGVMNASGESAGGSSCGTSGCHNDLFDSDPAKATMHGNIFGINYKHYMDNDATDDRGGFTQSGASWYPTNKPSGTATNLSSRRCLMCHVDHDIFSPDYNPSSPGRSSNMRASINFIPVGSDTTTYQNTDFDETKPEGGICVSCHNTEREKYLETPNDATKTPPVPFEMAGDITKAVDVFKKSTHAYSVTSAPFKGPDGTGTSTFQANCLKCHNDTIGGNTGPKSSVSGQDSDGNQPAFGRHISSNDSSMAFMGVTYEQGTATGGSATTLTRTGAGWSDNVWVGYDVIITRGTGEHQRGIIVSNTTDTLTVQSPPGFTTPPDNTSEYDIVRSPLPAQELCFSCHSKVADGRKDLDDLDWYEEEPMKDLLQRMESIFVGDKGVNRTTNGNKDTVIEICTKKSDTQLAAGEWENYVYKAGTFKTVILSNTLPAGPPGDTTCSGPYPAYPYHVTLSINQLDNNFYPIQAGSPYEVFKPASHPLDNYGRHRPYERVEAPGAGGILGTAITMFWNMGDEGVASEGSTASTLVDIEKEWGTDMWTAGGDAGTAMYLYMQSGLNTGLKEMIFSNTATSLTLQTAFPNLIAAGDVYYIGTVKEARHTSCVDCHNTHASTPNPEDAVTLADANDTNTECGTTDTCLVVASSQNDFWPVDEWKGHYLKLRKPDNHTNPSLQGHEQIRFITGFDPQFAGGTKGKYTIATKWRYPPQDGDHYEVIMSDRWDAVTGQEANRAGSGSTGTWGVTISGWDTGTGFVQGDGNLVDTSLLTYTKVENVFDKTGNYGGSPDTGQRDLCIRCHSYYAYRTARPSVPDGEPDVTDISDYGKPARESDIAADYNPNNVAHHAVYARGNNQPIQKGTNPYPVNAFNPNWPVWSGTIASVNSSTCEVDLGANMPETVLPGWFLYVGDTGWGSLNSSGGSIKFFEVWTLIDQQRVTVDPCPVGTESGSFFLTSGLGNTFVPPFGPWSILRCTDCHGTTKTDPVGPHASSNKWLLRDGDYNLKLEWWNGSAVQDVDYETEWVNGVNEKRYLCYNCHRVDAYGSKDDAANGFIPVNGNLTRLDHGAMFDADPRIYQECNEYIQDNCSYGVGWSQFCRHCHGGDKLGAIHGSNMAQVKGDAVPQSIRFLNGASWSNGLKRPTPADSDLICYTLSNPANVSGCAGHANGKPARGLGSRYEYDGY